MNKSLWAPTLVGKKIRLRPLIAGDFAALFEVAKDPELWALHSEPNRYQEAVFRPFFDKALESQGALVVEDISTGKVIGGSRFYEYIPDHRQVVVGYTFLAREYWGTTTNRELKLLMLDYAFQHVNTILFHTSDSNTRSQRSMEKLGATRRKGLINMPGVGLRIEYSITKEQWQTLRGACDV